MKLTDFELKAVRKIVEREAPSLSDALEKLSVSERQDSGVGKFVKFSMPELPPDSDSSLTLGGDLYADIDGMKFGVGFMLYVDRGFISELEVFSHGNETIPDRIASFNFCYL